MVLTAGAGYSRLISSMAADGLSKNGLTGTVRLMWAPEHLLSVGVEGGYQTLYVLENQTAGPDYGTSRVRVVQTSVPLHLAFAARDRKSVDAFYAAAIAAGGKDNGAPGVRAHYHPAYYGAFVLDPDGHNVEAVCHEPFLS